MLAGDAFDIADRIIADADRAASASTASAAAGAVVEQTTGEGTGSPESLEDNSVSVATVEFLAFVPMPANL